MKALQYEQFGGTEVLAWNEVSTPVPGKTQILVQVKAACLNPTDTKIRMGYIKFPGADSFPKGMGMDFSGIVTEIGADVSKMKVGDKVMGYMGAAGGSYADYTLADEINTFLMPDNLSFEEATTLPMNAATALKVVETYLTPVPAKAILINGASGGIGLFVVQYCKNAGAVVTGTATGNESITKLERLGIEVIDFKAINILDTQRKWEAILDTSGKLDFDEAKMILTDNGEFSTMVPKGDPRQPGRTDGAKKERLVFAVPGLEEFESSQLQAASGRIKTFVGQTFPMADAIDAISKFESGQLNVTGKIVLVVQESPAK